MKLMTSLLALFYVVFLWGQVKPTPTESEKDLRYSGDIIQYAMPIGTGLTTIIIGDKAGTWQFVKSFTANIAITYALKYAIDKPRPKGATDGLAFPSGHTSTVFQSAAFIQKRYGWEYGIPAYLLAGYVGYTRLQGEKERHDGWDVLGGAVTGIVSSYIFTRPYQKNQVEVAISAGDGYYTVGVVCKF